MAAPFLDPRPPDLRNGVFKVRSTPSGVPPTTGDVLRTIEQGLPGSGMPPFSFLPEKKRRWVAAYVLSIAGLLDGPEPSPIPSATAPPVPGSTGRDLYAVACAGCHGETGRGDGPAAASLRDDGGRPIKVRDLAGGIFLGGQTRADIYLRITTGMDGSPMPGFSGALTDLQRWAVTDYVLSLRSVGQVEVYPDDPLQAGRTVAAKHHCRACHKLDDGLGGNVGPDLRVSGRKLGTDWIKRFLADPRATGAVYGRRGRMPRVPLTAAEIDVLAAYMAGMGQRRVGPAELPPRLALTGERLAEARALFVGRCAGCHKLGQVVENHVADAVDLIHVAGRLDYAFAGDWLRDPKKIDPLTSMLLQPPLTAEEIELVREFVWKSSIEATPALGWVPSGRGADPPP